MECSNQCVTEANKWHQGEGGLCVWWLVKKISSDRGADSVLKNSSVDFAGNNEFGTHK